MRQPPRATLLLIALLLCACQSAPRTSEPVAGEGEAEAPAPPLAPLAEATPWAPPSAIRPLLAASQLERVEPWREPAPGNAGTLTVPETEDASPDTPLALERIHVRVQILGRFARTEVTQVFRSHLDRQSEGIYTFTLPEGAAISRLAMDVEGVMMEGELVERARARNIYESIVESQRDPALLEWQGTGRFKTQIFPIPARGTKTVVLAYDQILDEDADARRYTYRFPKLQDETPIEEALVELEADGAITHTSLPVEPGEDGVWRWRAQALPADAELALSLEPSTRVGQPSMLIAQRDASRYMAAHLRPDLTSGAGEGTPRVVIAIDSSAGLGQSLLQQAREAGLALTRSLDAEAGRFEWLYGDLGVHACTDGPTAPTAIDRDGPLRDCILDHTAGGATDLLALARAAIERAAGFDGRAAVVLVTDGVASLGVLDSAELRRRILEQIGDRDITLHVVANGHRAAQAELRALARASGGRLIRMNPGHAPERVASELAEMTRAPLLTELRVEVASGLDALHLHGPRSLLPGEALTISARMLAPSATVVVHGRYQGAPFSEEITLAPAPSNPVAPAASRLWARAEIRALEATPERRDAVVALSLEHGVMSRYTSFLVLENEEAYERWGVERRKLAERAEELQNLGRAQRLSDLEGTVGYGSGGMGMTGSGRGAGGRLAGASRIRVGSAEPAVMGSLDRNLIRDVIRRETPAIKRCYERALAQEREAHGRLVVRWWIDVKGNVSRAEIARSDLPEAMNTCVLEVIASLAFPAPAGGGVQVAYPFVFTRGGDDSEEPVVIDVHERVETLQALSAPSLEEEGELLAMLVLSDRLEDADAVYERLASRLDGADEEAAALYEILGDPLLRERYADGLFVSARAKLRLEPSEALAEEVFRGLRSRDDWAGVTEDFTGFAVSPALAGSILDAAVEDAEAERGGALLTSWGHLDAEATFTLLDAEEERRDAWPEAHFEAMLEVARTTPEDDAHMSATVERAVALEREADAMALVEARCQPEVADAEACRGWLKALPGGAPLLHAIALPRIEELVVSRREDMGDIETIASLSGWVRDAGYPAEASRTLSEMVEFAPHDFDARLAYAQALTDEGELEGACAQYALAGQIDPAQREGFRQMNALRRRWPERGEAVRACVADGVSRLPIERDLSLVLTWDDPEADVDLHVHEPSGEEVSFESMRAESGGLLYYDITDGYGPEIYVLGAAAAGDYRVTVVYYSGSAEVVSGTLTVLRAAGTPSEAREVIPFSLDAAREKEPLVITTLSGLR